MRIALVLWLTAWLLGLPVSPVLDLGVNEAANAASRHQPRATTGSGYDGDTRACVTHREVWIIGNPDLTRLQVETRWETVGLGWQQYIPGFGNAWAYHVCDTTTEWAWAKFSNGTLVGLGLVSNVG